MEFGMVYSYCHWKKPAESPLEACVFTRISMRLSWLLSVATTIAVSGLVASWIDWANEELNDHLATLESLFRVATGQRIPGKVRESEKMCRKSGNFTNFVIIREKIRKKCPAIYLVVKFPKIKCLFCQLIISLIKAIWESQLFGQGKFIKKGQGKPGKGREFQRENYVATLCLCIIKHCIEQAKI